MEKNMPKQNKDELTMDAEALSELIRGKLPLPSFKNFNEIPEYLDALSNFIKQEYPNSGSESEGFIGFVNQDMRVEITDEVKDVTTREKFGSDLCLVLIPKVKGESKEDQLSRKLFYHKQFRETTKASQVALAFVLYKVTNQSGLKNFINKYKNK